jgi:hypothetical protein
MTASVVSAAVAAFVARLQAAPAVTASVTRTRLRPLSKDVSEAVVVRPLDADPGESDFSGGSPVSWSLRLAVDIYFRAPAGSAPDEAVDPLVQAVYARLMADPTLGAAVRWIQPAGLAYEFDAEAEQVCCATFTFLALITASPTVFTP